MTVRKSIAITGAAGMALSGAILATPQAVAATPAEQHCVANLTTGKTQCFGSLSEALGQARSTTKASATAKTKAGQAVQGEVIQGTFFDNRDYGGDSYTVVGAGLCDGSDGVINYEFTFPPEWRNKISSVQPWASCKIWLYPDTELTGDRDGPFKENTGWVGTMLDDKADSVGFS